MISFQQIQYILAIEETRHFQKASDLCFVTQPTLSMQVKKAEEVLGYPVFDRSSSPLSLTPFGEDLIPILRELQIDFDNIQKLVLKSSGRYKERLRLAIIPTISPFMVSDMFDKWKSLLPNVQLVMEEMKSEEILLALDRNEVDLAILAGPINNEKLRVNPLFKEEIKAYIPSIKNTEISTESLQKLHPWLLSKGNCLRTQMIHFCELGASKNDQWNYEGGNLELLLRIVDSKGGYTLVPEASKLFDEMTSFSNSANVKLVVDSIDRLGRSLIDILTTVKLFTQNGINLQSLKEGFCTLLDNGKENPTATLVFSVMGSIAEIERNRIKERTTEGIAIAKSLGKFKGRKLGTKTSDDDVLKKYSTIIKKLQKGLSIREIAKIFKCSTSTVNKVRKIIVKRNEV